MLVTDYFRSPSSNNSSTQKGKPNGRKPNDKREMKYGSDKDVKNNLPQSAFFTAFDEPACLIINLEPPGTGNVPFSGKYYKYKLRSPATFLFIMFWLSPGTDAFLLPVPYPKLLPSAATLLVTNSMPPGAGDPSVFLPVLPFSFRLRLSSSLLQPFSFPRRGDTGLSEMDAQEQLLHHSVSRTWSDMWENPPRF